MRKNKKDKQIYLDYKEMFDSIMKSTEDSIFLFG